MTNGELLGKKLYELRKNANLSQEEFAEKLNVSRQAVSKWECGDALPDTENLIKISKLYGVSLDELVGNTPQKQNRESEEPEQENAQQTSYEENTQSTRKKGIHIDENEIHIDVEGKIQFDDDGIHVGGKNGIHIDDDGVHVGGEGGIHIDDDGVHVGGEDGIHIANDNIHVGEKEVNINVHVDVPTKKRVKKEIAMRLLRYLPYPIIITIAYLLWGFLWNGWAIGWTLYVTVPVYYSILECIRKKKASCFAYPALITFIYLFVGMQWDYWHPNWILFITIPVYYAIVEAIEKR
ncbi:MAG: helix-turn-helix transcriptional regulator [Clostridia bacterium]|nr:helix-turn-helix transcriptional regulator [Clostridia bacterium]